MICIIMAEFTLKSTSDDTYDNLSVEPVVIEHDL